MDQMYDCHHAHICWQIYACLMLFFVFNAIEGQLISTGAFEISLNGRLDCCNVMIKFSLSICGLDSLLIL